MEVIKTRTEEGLLEWSGGNRCKCGNPATVIKSELQEEIPEENWRRFRSTGKVFYFCDECAEKERI